MKSVSRPRSRHPVLVYSVTGGPADGEQQFRELYKELVETNTTLSAGNCTLAADAWRHA
jgi:hypothetical protein